MPLKMLFAMIFEFGCMVKLDIMKRFERFVSGSNPDVPTNFDSGVNRSLTEARRVCQKRNDE